MRVLVVEDNGEFARLVTARLTRAGFDTDQAKQIATPGRRCDQILSAGNLSLDTENHQVIVGDQMRLFRLKEVTVLELLLRHEGRVVPRTRMLSANPDCRCLPLAAKGHRNLFWLASLCLFILGLSA